MNKLSIVYIVVLFISGISGDITEDVGRSSKERTDWSRIIEIIDSVKEREIISGLHYLKEIREEELENKENNEDIDNKLGVSEGGECLMSLLDLPFNEYALRSFIMNSGFGVNHLGDYTACNASPSSKYYSSAFVTGFGVVVRLGVCVPHKCTKVGMYGLNKYMAKGISAMLGYPGAVGEHSIFWIDPKEKYSESSESTGGYITFLFFYCVIGVLLVVGTLFEYIPSYITWEEKEVCEKERKLREGETELSITARYSNKGADPEAGPLLPGASGTSGTSLHKERSITPPKSQKSPKLSRIQEFFLCFSVIRNSKAILHGVNKVDKNLDVLNGVRVLSIGWVVLGHCYFWEMMYGPILNMKDYTSHMLTTYTSSIVNNATFSVDVFFYLAGFLSTISFCGAFIEAKKRKVMAFVIAYLHRYIRLLPIYGTAILAAIYVVPRLAEAPTYYQLETQTSTCTKYWWKNLLYISNFGSSADECIGWSWYLANDFQFFLINPLICLVYCIDHASGLLIMIFCFLGSFAAQIYVSLHFNISPSVLGANATEQANEYYDKPYCRVNTYLLGMVFAWLYLEHKNKHFRGKNRVFAFINESIRNNRIVRYIMYVVCGGLTYIIIYTIYIFNKDANGMSKASNTIYLILTRPAFVLGIGFILHAVLIDRGKFLLAILGHPVFNAWGKIVFTIYMAHPFIYEYFICTKQNGYFFSDTKFVYLTLCCFILVTLVAFVITLAVESPIVQLEKLYLLPKPPNREGEKGKGNLEGKEVRKDVDKDNNKDNKEEEIVIPKLEFKGEGKGFYDYSINKEDSNVMEDDDGTNQALGIARDKDKHSHDED